MNPNGHADGESRFAQMVMVDTRSKLEVKLDELTDKLDGLIGVVSDMLKRGAQ